MRAYAGALACGRLRGGVAGDMLCCATRAMFGRSGVADDADAPDAARM